MFEATIKPVEARNSPIPEIEIGFSIKNTEDRHILLIGYALDFKINGVEVGNVADYVSYQLYPKNQIQFNQKFNVSPHAFAAIERARKSGDVQLSSNIKVLYHDTEIEQNPNYPNPRSYRLSTASFKMSQKEWIQFISEMGYVKYKIFEIPYSDTPQLPEFENIMNSLEAAQILFYEGKNEEVVSKCRTMLEQFRVILKDEEKKAKIDGKIDERGLGEQGRDSKSKRIHDIFTKVYNFHNVGPHYPYHVSREDAEMSLVMCMSLLRYYGVQLDKLT